MFSSQASENKQPAPMITRQQAEAAIDGKLPLWFLDPLGAVNQEIDGRNHPLGSDVFRAFWGNGAQAPQPARPGGDELAKALLVAAVIYGLWSLAK
jgi:hypothetical protein